MRRARWQVAIAACTLALGLTACGGEGAAEGPVDVQVADNPTFAPGTTMEQLAKDDKVKVGVKFDQPGLGSRVPGEPAPKGFDVEIAKIIAGKLGIEPEKIEWVETVSANREPFIQQGQVDYVVASYSINDERKKVIDFAGPYYVTGQQLLVRKDSDIQGPDDLKGKSVCSVTGSTSIKTVQEKYNAEPKPFATYTECVTQLKNKAVDAVTTDGSILLGYAAQDPENLKVVGQPFSTERYGIGMKEGQKEFCTFVNDALRESFQSGKWKEAFNATLGKSGVEAPEPPALDPCE